MYHDERPHPELETMASTAYFTNVLKHIKLEVQHRVHAPDSSPHYASIQSTTVGAYAVRK